MKGLRKSVKSPKITKKDLIFSNAKKKFLYEAKKKFGKKGLIFDLFFFSEGNFFSEKLEINEKAAEKAINNKEALYVKTPLNPIIFNRDNPKEFQALKVITLTKRILDEKPDRYNRPFNGKYNTNNIFFVK